jgi:uncharacterized protein YggT (Ycf19 family)
MAKREPKPPYEPEERRPEDESRRIERVERLERVHPLDPDEDARGSEPGPGSRPGERAVEVERRERVEYLRPVEDDHPRSERPAQGAYEPARARATSSALARIRHAVDYAFGLLYGLLAIRLVLALLGAREGAAFTRFIQSVTEPFYAPFQGIVARPAVDGSYFDAPIVIALLAYLLLHVAVRGLIRVIEGRPSA